MKSVVGKDLTKVTMPVHFNEPLSFLQVCVNYRVLNSLVRGFEDKINTLLIKIML